MRLTELTSTGQLASVFQRSPFDLVRLLGEIGEKPALKLDARDYWDAVAVDKLRQQLTPTEQKKDS